MATFNFGLNAKNKSSVDGVNPPPIRGFSAPEPSLPIKQVNSDLVKNGRAGNFVQTPEFYATANFDPQAKVVEKNSNNSSLAVIKQPLNNDNFRNRLTQFAQAQGFEGQESTVAGFKFNFQTLKTNFLAWFNEANVRWLVLFLVGTFFSFSFLVFLSNNSSYFATPIVQAKALETEYFLSNYLQPSDDFSSTQTLLIDLPSNLQTQQTKFKENTGYLPKVDTKLYKNFTSEQFANLYDGYIYNKVQATKTIYPIRGDVYADAQIRTLAEARGYKRRSQAIESGLVTVDTQQVQSEIKDAWLAMKSAAASEKLNLVLVSGYRSPDDQKSLFNQDLGNTFTNKQIGDGLADAKINTVLKTRSIPGYSRHHTGYTIDIGCDNTDLLPFGDTKCYEWLLVYNFLNAKRFGFIPSYPNGIKNQGPDPEPWEFVWVGENSVKG